MNDAKTELAAGNEMVDPGLGGQEISTNDLAGSDVDMGAGGGAKRPAGLPEKFWDDDQQTVRADALANSYIALEQKFGSLEPRDFPETPDDYQIVAEEGAPQVDPEVNARLHEAGFSQAQAQLVYDLASEYLMPMVAEVTSEYSRRSEIDELTKHFGGEDRWGEVSGQIRDWGKANLSEGVFHNLSSTMAGVKAMHDMMSAEEPAMMREGRAEGGPESESALRTLMRDPKYWRDHDPAIVAKVKAGFERLYPD